ncbi:hypothetical protein [Streptomyces sp. NPDC005573]|uniref:hypothetical protein n=1 Tax=Streptomyces sp. NPDC005573 TaxID=3156890 RepID=UPI0033B764FD
MIERPYDGGGKCLLGIRRLSRMKLTTSSPERQRENVLTVAASVGGHIIDRADDWEVSGATDPMTRPKLGLWLRGERGPYDGLVAGAVRPSRMPRLLRWGNLTVAVVASAWGLSDMAVPDKWSGKGGGLEGSSPPRAVMSQDPDGGWLG